MTGKNIKDSATNTKEEVHVHNEGCGHDHDDHGHDDHGHVHHEGCGHDHSHEHDQLANATIEQLASMALKNMSSGDYFAAVKSLEVLLSKAVIEGKSELTLWKAWLAKSYFEIKDENKAHVLWSSIQDALKSEGRWDEWAESLLTSAYILKIKGKTAEAEKLVLDFTEQVKSRVFSDKVTQLKDLLEVDVLLKSQKVQDAKLYVEGVLEKAKGNKNFQRIFLETSSGWSKLKNSALAEKLKKF